MALIELGCKLEGNDQFSPQLLKASLSFVGKFMVFIFKMKLEEIIRKNLGMFIAIKIIGDESSNQEKYVVLGKSTSILELRRRMRVHTNYIILNPRGEIL